MITVKYPRKVETTITLWSLLMFLQPFYGGKLHKVSSEVKNPAGDVILRVQGEWNGAMEFSYHSVSNRGWRS